MKCANCGKKVNHGQDCVVTQKGVLGPRGFVPLESSSFCCDRCIAEYFSDPLADRREDDVAF